MLDTFLLSSNIIYFLLDKPEEFRKSPHTSTVTTFQEIL